MLDDPSLLPMSGGPARQLVVLLHGVGADGNDLIDLARFYQDVLPDAVFVAPNAPFRFDMAPFGYQWFSVQNLQPDTRLNGARRAAPIVDAFIDSQLGFYGLKEDNTVIVGFSQGAMVGLHVGLRREKRLAGIISHSGMLVGEQILANEIKTRPPVLLTHGAVDNVLPAAALSVAKAALEQVGVPVEAHFMPGLGHELDDATIRLDQRFFREVFLGEGAGERRESR